MSKNNLKPYVDYLLESGINKEDGYKIIKEDANLTQDEKNMIYCYCYPRQLLDRELPSRVQNYRKTNNIPDSGLLTPIMGEITLLIEAARTEQYGRFMKHLVFAFSDPLNINPVAGNEIKNCAICGKPLCQHELWNEKIIANPGSSEKSEMQYLAYGSCKSSENVILCKDCLVQLISASQYLKEIDPDFFDWRGKMAKQTKRSWEDLKL